MSSDKKKVKETVDSLIDEGDKEALSLIAEATESYLSSEQVGQTDPFEIYVKRVHSRLHRSPEIFAERLEKGYSVLLRELSQ